MFVISFRRVTRLDFPLLASWLCQPRVARWWNHEFSLEAIERDFGKSVDETEPCEDHLVLLDDQPIRLMQYNRYVDYPGEATALERHAALPTGAVNIDYLIGDPGFVGRGLGAAMIARFAERIWDVNPDAPCIIVPVVTANIASWRALQSAGFRAIARGEIEPDNPIDDPSHEILRLDRP